MSKPKTEKPISDATKRQILEAAWTLFAQRGRADVGLAEIAAEAGVSRQTVFYAFGNRAGVLTAMARHKDTTTEHVARLRAALFVENATPDALVDAAEAWLDYLPVIYPVGILLDAASLTDADAASAWKDRMIDALLGGFAALARRVRTLDDPRRVAEEIWAELHPSMWRRLVVECGWTPRAFRESRLRVVRALVGVPAPRPAPRRRARDSRRG